MLVSVVDFPSICRLCLKKGDLAPFKQKFLVELLETIINIDFSSDRDLPSNICAKCTELLNQISIFINATKYNDMLLKFVLSNHQYELIDDIKEDLSENETTETKESIVEGLQSSSDYNKTQESQLENSVVKLEVENSNQNNFTDVKDLKVFEIMPSTSSDYKPCNMNRKSHILRVAAKKEILEYTTGNTKCFCDKEGCEDCQEDADFESPPLTQPKLSSLKMNKSNLIINPQAFKFIKSDFKKVHKCSRCNKSFKKYAYMKKHMARHICVNSKLIKNKNIKKQTYRDHEEEKERVDILNFFKKKKGDSFHLEKTGNLGEIATVKFESKEVKIKEEVLT